MSRARHLRLHQWLATLPDIASGHRLVGGTGHLLLNADERRNVENRLEAEIFPLLFSSARHVTIATGAAPGADLLFARTAQRWLTRAGIGHDLVALLPIPVDQLLEDWVQRVSENAIRPDAAERERVRRAVRALIEECAAVVDLMPQAVDPLALGDPALRRQQYQQLAAVLAEQSDLLIALLRHDEALRSGGTAEVVDWRRYPERVPAALSTVGQRRPTGHGQLWIIDPAQAVETRRPASQHPVGSGAPGIASSVLAQARRALDSGNYLRCYDLLRRAQERGLASQELDYLSLLALANAGSTELALKCYRSHSIPPTADEDWLALEGRLLKDQAAAAAPAAEAYHAAFERTGGRFPALNAASMYLLAGAAETALPLARRLLDELGGGDAADETDDYYRSVTEAEAALLLGDINRAHTALRRADALLRGNVNVRSRSLAQLRRICLHLQIDLSLLEALRLPPVVCLRYPYPLSDRPAIDALVRERAIVFIDLTETAALDMIERVQQIGLRVHLVLAAQPTDLTSRWRHHYGNDTAARLEAVLASAHDLSVALGFIDGEEASCRDYVAAMSVGLSRLMAQRLGSRWIELSGATHLVGAARQMTAPDARTRYGRLCVGMLFADFVGFSRLDDRELPAFWTAFTDLVQQLAQRHCAGMLYHRTWGDALHVVASSARAIAEIALDLRASLERLRPQLRGGTARLELRLAAHIAPVFVDGDPASDTAQFFGSQLSFAARVEPVTPPGSVFVTEAFAARLTLEAGTHYCFDYAGEIELPKEFGKYRLFGLRACPAHGPAV
jgi:hypothetical protein